MIDTDKYEGHSTGWKRKINHSTYSIINDDGQKVASVPCYEECNLDSELIADAPLLLEEIKRLREQQQKILRIAETNMALEWGDTDASVEWGYIIDMIKGWTE